jgi:Domain of unknown function (DUF4436)
MRLGIVGLVLFISAYVGSIVLYANSGTAHPHQIADSQPAADGTTVTVDVEDIQSSNSLLLANLAVTPGPALLDPQTHALKQDLTVVTTSVATAGKRTWPKGALPDVFRVSLALTGDVANWPFDRYRTGPITVEVFYGDAQTPEQVPVTLVDRLLGWKIDVAPVGNAERGAHQLELLRSTSTVAFGVVILAVLIALAGLGLFVAVQTARDRRKFQPPMTTWYGAMLFAVMPLRNALPDSPPFGGWIDVTIVLWVIVVLVVSMTLYISCWWRHLRPEHGA